MKGVLRDLDARGKQYGINEHLEIKFMALKEMKMASVSGTTIMQREQYINIVSIIIIIMCVIYE